MLQHALACPAWLVQGEKCQFCTFSFSPIQFQFHREWVFDRNLRLNNKFTLHDSFFQRAREWSGEKSKDALYEIEIKMNRDSSLRNVLEMRFPSRDSMTGICAALRDLSMKYLLTLLIAVQNPKCLVPVKWRAQRVETVSKSRGKRQRHRRRIVHYARTHYIGSLQAFNYFNGNICKCIYKAFLSGINSATRKLQWFAVDGILLAWNREEPIIMHLGWVILEIKCKQKAE